MEYSGVYRILNTENGREYIGSSIRVEERINSHICSLIRGKHANKNLQKDWNFYDMDCFDFGVLEICEEHLVVRREQWYIDEYNPFYNISKKAIGGRRKPNNKTYSKEKVKPENLSTKEWNYIKNICCNTKAKRMRKCDIEIYKKNIHLFSNNNKMNIGRLRGESHGQSLFKNDDIVDMRKMFNAGKSIRDISTKYNAKYITIWMIVNRRSWKHIK